MKPMVGKRVLMLLENNPYPQDVRVRREAVSLANAGYRVTVISPQAKGQPKRDTVNGVEVRRYPPPPEGSGFLGFVWEYAYSMVCAFFLTAIVFVQKGFDIIHAHNPPDTFAFIAAPYKLFGVKFIFDHHDLSPEMYYARLNGMGNPSVYRVLIALEKFSCRLADRVIATNESYKRMQMQRGRVAEERISIVRNGPDIKDLRLAPPDSDLRAQGRILIGYVGVMGVQDGVDYLLRALRCLISDLGRTDFTCLLIGTGSAWSSLKTLATELGLDSYVCFTGWVSDADLLRYLSSLDICVDPDPSNPFNDRCTMIKIMEYMALAKPVVAFDLPEHRVTAQEAALYARPNDELNFAEQIVRLMDDPDLRELMGKIGRERVEKQLAWSHQAKKLLAAYEALG